MVNFHIYPSQIENEYAREILDNHLIAEILGYIDFYFINIL